MASVLAAVAGGRLRAEVCVVTAWGEVPSLAQLDADLPSLVTPSAVRESLAARLALWRGETPLGKL